MTNMQFNKKDFSYKFLLDLHEALLLPRLIEEKMLLLLRQNKISKWFSGIGQEAISVGAAMAMQEDEFILPLHRNLGVFSVRDINLTKLFAQFQGKVEGFTKGRDRSFHFTSMEHYIHGMISHLGPQLTVANGIALADKLNQNIKTTLVFSGDGGTSEGDFHEALNLAAVWNLPVIFLIENNGFGLSTPNSEQFKIKSFVDKGAAYGIDALSIDGNNVLEVYNAISQAAQSIIANPRPILIEANTFRMRGHEEASGTKYVPEELFQEWALKDPVENYENYLIDEQILTSIKAKFVREKLRTKIEHAVNEAFDYPEPTANALEELADVYAPHHFEKVKISSAAQSDKRYIDAISDGLDQSMVRHNNLILMGQDIAEYGGVFKVTEGFVKKFGKERVRNTPLCESAIIGASVGLSLKGYNSVIEMQFADFVTCGFNQIVNNLAKLHYRTGLYAKVVIRMPTGAGVAAGPFHSQSNEAWFFHTPGLKIVYPSNPYDAKGLLCEAINDPNPVLYFEHKALYRSISATIPDDYYTLPIGKAKIVAEGEALTIITYGMGVKWAKQIKEELQASIEIVDLCTLLPWDKETVKEAVKKTGRVLVANEDTLTGSISAEIAAWIAENCFSDLDAPIHRVGSLETPVPFAPNLENEFLPYSRMKQKVLSLLQF